MLASKSIKKETDMFLCLGNNTELGCSGMRGATNFYESWSPFANGHTPYCKDCCQKMIDYYIKNGCSMKSAVYYTCLRNDIPFILEVWAGVENRMKEGRKEGKRMNNYLGLYISELHKSKTKKNIWNELSATNVNLSDIDSRIEQRELRQKELDEFELNWGKQESSEDYQYLERTYERYTKNVEIINEPQDDLYRDLCRDRLLLRKIDDGSYNGEETRDKVQNRIIRDMNKLRIDEYESNKPKTASEQSLFEKIRLVDENNVEDVYSEPSRYYDLNKVHQYEKDMVLRPLGNMLAGNRDFNLSIDDIDKYNLD